MNRNSAQTTDETAGRRQSSDNAHAESAESRQGSGRGWHGDPQAHAAAGSKGGRKVSQDRQHMASIGRKGGQAVSRDRQHMAEIGRKGGRSRSDTGSESGSNDTESRR